jgi:integrase/recombinase XerD
VRNLWGGRGKYAVRTSAANTIVDHGGLWTLLRAFLEWSDIKGYSPATTEGRRRDLVMFVRWAHERDITDWRLVDKHTLHAFQRHLFSATKKSANGDGAPLSTRTQVGRLHALQAMFRFLVKHDHVAANPAADLEMPRVTKTLPKHALSIDEAEKLMLVPDVLHPLGVRLRAILETFYSTGIRRLELIHLDLGDVDFGHGTDHVRNGKGGKDRFVPIGERALLWVQKYLVDVRSILVADPGELALFVTNKGEPFSPPRLNDMVSKAVDDADVGKKGSCHLLRHTMATLMLNGGADLRFVQAMLGHAQISTTEIYTHVAIAKLKEVHARTHPAKLVRDDDVTRQ